MNTEQSGPPRIPLIGHLSQRGGTLDTDARLINGYVEKLETGEFAVIKRPGITLFFNTPGTGGGLTYYLGDIYNISGATLYKNGLGVSAISATGGTYTFSATLGGNPRLFMHNVINAYYLDPGTGLNFIGALSGPQWVTGQVYLDGTTYIMDTANNIRGSGINDLLTWNVLNTISAQMEPSGASALFPQLQYVVALKQASVETFWDAGNPTGSPLQSNKGVFLPYGCRQSGSIQRIEDNLLWVGAMAPKGGLVVLRMENMAMRTISTPPVERALQQADFSLVYSLTLHFSGHRFYILTLVHNNLTLVYDLDTNLWFQWKDENGNYLPWIASTTATDNQNLIQHENGSVYKVDPTIFMDNGGTILVDLYTPSWDGGTEVKKYLPRMDFHCDNKGMGTALVRWTDDDYQTFSNFRQVDLSKADPILRDMGTFKKRAWHIRYAEPTALRLKFIELHPMLGTT